MDLNWNYLFTSFDGRINRKPFWICILIVVVTSIVVSVVVGAIVGFTSSIFAIFSLLMQLALLYPFAAVMAKRLHDRDRPTWWIAIFLVPSILQGVAGVIVDPTSIIMTGLTLVSFVIGVWFIVELGCLRGTVGPNQFGPDPLESQQL